MHIGRMLALVAPLLAALACGGIVEPDPGGGGGSSSGGSSSGSSGGSGSGGSSGSSSGGVTCPDPQSVQPGASCSAAGSTCPSDIAFACAGGPGGGGGGPGGPIQCTCTDGSWFCPEPECPVGCPDPSEVVPGGSCGLPSSLSCASNTPIVTCDGTPVGNLQCQCFSGQWECPEPGPDCQPDGGPGTCPPPQQVQDGVTCNAAPGETCPGNPQVCDGQVDYDAFECQSGVWTDVATTVCEGPDGGPVDASDDGWSEDGGPSEAGFVDAGMGI
jgi:hypothetical protein